jgi:hypothetical protein
VQIDKNFVEKVLHTIDQPFGFRKHKRNISFKTSDSARHSLKYLWKQFEKAKTVKKKQEIVKVTEYAGRRAVILSKQIQDRPYIKRDLLKIASMYSKTASRMAGKYRNVDS